MNAKRLHYVLLGTIGICVLVLFAGVYAANLLLKSQSARVEQAQLKNLVLEEKQRTVIKARADIAKYKDLAAIAKNIVPQDKDQAQTIREIVKIAEASGVKLGTITFPTSTLGGVKPGVKSSGNPALSQLKAVAGISGVYSLDITVESDASSPSDYSKFIAFLDGLEHNRRTALVSGITLQPNSTDPSKLTFSLIVSEYIKP